MCTRVRSQVLCSPVWVPVQHQHWQLGVRFFHWNHPLDRPWWCRRLTAQGFCLGQAPWGPGPGAEGRCRRWQFGKPCSPNPMASGPPACLRKEGNIQRGSVMKHDPQISVTSKPSLPPCGAVPTPRVTVAAHPGQLLLLSISKILPSEELLML